MSDVSNISMYKAFMVQTETWPSGQGFAGTVTIKRALDPEIVHVKSAYYAEDTEAGFLTPDEVIKSAFKWAQHWIDDALQRGQIE